MVNERSVRILLECILVDFVVSHFKMICLGLHQTLKRNILITFWRDIRSGSTVPKDFLGLPSGNIFSVNLFRVPR